MVAAVAVPGNKPVKSYESIGTKSASCGAAAVPSLYDAPRMGLALLVNGVCALCGRTSTASLFTIVSRYGTYTARFESKPVFASAGRYTASPGFNCTPLGG